MSPLWQLGNAIEFHYMDGESEFRLEESSVLEALLKEQRRSMKKLLILAALLVLLPIVSDAAQVRGHFRKDGTYIAPYQRSNPDNSPYNSYNFPGNYNPNKGQTTPGNQETYLERYREQQRRNDLNFDWNK
jgi:hypothetical protein